MPLLKLVSFGGTIPVSGDRALPDGFAVESLNTWLYGKELRGIRPWDVRVEVAETTKKVFRIPKRTVGGDPTFPTKIPPPSYLGDSVWVQFTDPDMDIVRSAMINDSFERWYFCSPTTGPMFNTYVRLRDGLAMYKLGIYGPDITIVGGFNAFKPTITSIVGGAIPVLTRAYVYTWVNEFGEESSPSLPVLGAGNTGAVWNIGNIVPPTAIAGYPAYTKKYLYRTITGTSGATAYYRIAEVPLATYTYADDQAVMTDAVLAQNLQLESTTWQPPPADLIGIIAMPNGFLIGWKSNTLYMSEAYHFHAWPTEYKQTTEYPIVGMGVLGTTAVACTEGYPATATGSKPAVMTFTKATTQEPCLSRGSIVSTPVGVLYASQNGLQMVGPGGIQNVTQQMIAREDWIKDYAPQYLRAVRYQNGFLALRNLPNGDHSGFFLDTTELRVALTEFTEFDDVINLHSDVWSGEVFVLEAGTVYRWDPPLSTDMWPVLWRSKEFQFPYDENFGAYAVHWDQARFAPNEYGLDYIAEEVPVRFRVWAGRVLVYDQPVPHNGRGIRLPSGFKSQIWQFEVRARAPVYSIHIASTMKELKSA